MRTQLHEMHEKGDPIGILWASEGAIYRRFGYGEHASSLSMMTMPTRMPFHPGVSVSDTRIRQVTREEAMPFMREVHDRVRRTRSARAASRTSAGTSTSPTPRATATVSPPTATACIPRAMWCSA